MARPTTLLRIPQPCPESWDAMTPSGPGRHCAACQKVVVDFSLKSDAEILAILARAGGGETCGRFGADQLERPLRPPAASGAPHSRWQAWLALALAAWGLGATAAAGTRPPAVASTLHPARKVGPVHHPARPAGLRLRGVVRDAATNQPIGGVAVFLKGENRSATTDSAGHFSLRVPAGRAHGRHALVLHRFGYHSCTLHLPAAEATALVHVELAEDAAGSEATVVAAELPVQRQILGGAVTTIVGAEVTNPTPGSATGRARSFFRWLNKPFRRD